MNARSFRLALPLSLLVAALALLGSAQAQVTGTLGSDVTTYFGSQADSYQMSNPAGPAWTPVGNNPPPYYASIPQLPNVPSPPGGNVTPSNVTPFAPISSTSSYNDGYGDTASSTILGAVGPPYTAQGAMVELLGGGMTLTETVGQYAYEQVNFDIDFSVANFVNVFGTAGTLGGVVTDSYAVSGLVGTGVGAFAAFGGQLNFWDATTNTSLGAPLDFNYFNNVGGLFSGTATGSTFVAPVNSPDVLRVTGDFFVIGDPSSIQVQSVPEPTTLLLFALGSLGLLALGRRRAIA